MEYLFECNVIISGAPGGFAYYIIFLSDNGSFWCKMKSWNQYRGLPVGDFALWKQGRKWNITGNESLTAKDVKDQIVKLIGEWKLASEDYKNECRKGFKFLDEKP